MGLGRVQDYLGFMLTGYELEALVCLARGASTPSRISKETGMPRPKAYEVLTSLVRKGLVKKLGGRPAKYELRPDAIRRLKEEVEEAHRVSLSFLKGLELTLKRGTFVNFKGVLTSEIRRLGGEILSVSDEDYAVLFRMNSLRFLAVFHHQKPEPEELKSLMEKYRARLGLVFFKGPMDEATREGLKEIGFFPMPIEEDLRSGLLSILEDLEAYERELKSLEERFSALKAEARDGLKDCFEALNELAWAIEGREGLDAYEKELKSLEERYLELKSEEMVFEDSVKGLGGMRPDALASKLRSAVDGLALVLEGLKGLRLDIMALEERVERVSGAASNLLIPYESPASLSFDDVIGQEGVKAGLIGFVKESSMARGPTLALLIGEFGAGKTHVLKALHHFIRNDRRLRSVPAFTHFSKEFVDVYNEMLMGLNEAMVREGRPPPFKSQRTFFGALRSFGEVWRELVDRGFRRIYWIVDGLKLEALDGEAVDRFINRLNYFLEANPDAPVSLILSCTPDSYSLMVERHGDFVSKIGRRYVFRLEPFGVREVKELIGRYSKFRVSEPFVTDLVRRSRGNPREAIKLFNEHVLEEVEGKRELR